MQNLVHNGTKKNYDEVVKELRTIYPAINGVNVAVDEDYLNNAVVLRIGDQPPLNMTPKQAEDLAREIAKSANLLKQYDRKKNKPESLYHKTRKRRAK